LILQVAGPGEEWRIFSTDEFKPPPNPETWAYTDVDHSAVSTVARLELRVSAAAASPGDQVRAEVILESLPGRELVALRWDVVVPAQVLELVGDGPETGRAVADSGKLVRCSMQKNYLYVCMLTDDQKPIMSGPIVIFHFKIRTDAQPGTTTLRIEKVEATTVDRRQFTLNGAEAAVAIQRRNGGS
jgi:hypothetical protein